MASAYTLRLMEEKGVYIVPIQIMATRPARLADDDAFWQALNTPCTYADKGWKYRDSLLDGARNIASSTVNLAFGTD